MPRESTGTAFLSRTGVWTIQVSIGDGKRRAESLPWCKGKRRAQTRAALIAGWVSRLRKAGHDAYVADAVRDGAAATTENELSEIETAIKELERKPKPRAVRRVLSTVPTFKTFAEEWTSGKLHKLYPDLVPIKASKGEDIYRLTKHVYPILKDIPLDRITLDHALEVMRSLPPKLSSGSRVQIAQLIRRVLQLATFPARYIEHNPIPKGFVHRSPSKVATGCIYPDEEAALLGCSAVPLPFRVMYAFLHREGMRAGEAGRMAWGDLDLERGAVRLDVNKTSRPRSWALDPSVVRALKTWRQRYRPAAKPKDHVFLADDGTPLDHSHRATFYREHLGQAGIARRELLKGGKNRRPVRFHDQRALFITTALANGKTETWVSDRTGHTTSQMVNRYRQQAREWTELNLGPLQPMDQAIPELREQT